MNALNRFIARAFPLVEWRDSLGDRAPPPFPWPNQEFKKSPETKLMDMWNQAMLNSYKQNLRGLANAFQAQALQQQQDIEEVYNAHDATITTYNRRLGTVSKRSAFDSVLGAKLW